MDAILNEELEALRAEVRRFAEEHVAGRGPVRVR